MNRTAWLIAAGIIIASSGWGCSSNTPSARESLVAQQETFATPEAAVDALAAAVAQRDDQRMQRLFGPRMREFGSGDRQQDDADLQRLSAALQRGYRLQESPEGTRLLIGPGGWEFPAPLVRQGQRWRFDTDEGVEEVMDRRVGRNELDAIATCRYYVLAQELYCRMNPEKSAVPVYAQRLASTDGRRDGLYWPVSEGERPSPLGPLVAQKIQSGELKTGTGRRQPYRGYFYKVLTRQGPSAAGGERSYIDSEGRMTGGFALLAWPEEYGRSGVMSFMVTKDGTVYQADLGQDTPKIAESATAFNPDAAWSPVTAPTTQPAAGG